MNDDVDESFDIWRDTWLRYLGYSNEVGEALRYVYRPLLVPSYIAATAYVVADVKHKAQQAHTHAVHRSFSSEKTLQYVKDTAIDTLLWQGLVGCL